MYRPPTRTVADKACALVAKAEAMRTGRDAVLRNEPNSSALGVVWVHFPPVTTSTATFVVSGTTANRKPNAFRK